MFTVDLTKLGRDGKLRVARTIAASDPLWSESGIALAEGVDVDIHLSTSATGQVLARGTIATATWHECTRCLSEMERAMKLDVTLLWSPPDELDDDDETDPDIRVLRSSDRELELGDAVREEILLAVPRFAVCSTECRGLCPKCGINRNEESCPCSFDEPDPRWDALRALQDE
jgi:uncharacterized protein